LKFCIVKPSVKIDSDKVTDLLIKNIWSFDVVSDENFSPNKNFKIRKSYQFKEGSLEELTEYFYEGKRMLSEYEQKNGLC